MGFTVECCENCGTLFNYPGFGSKYCPLCREEDTKRRNTVKEFLRSHGNANMYEISLATGIPEKQVKQYLRDGMLEIPEGSPVYIKCECCGCDIRSGRWCPSCAARLSAGTKASYVSVGEVPREPMGPGKMRFIGHHERK